MNSIESVKDSNPFTVGNPTNISSKEQTECEAIQTDTNILKKEIDAHETELAKERMIDEIIKTSIGNNPFVIEVENVEKILKLSGLTIDDLMKKLVPIAKNFALPPISNYKVGEAALGKSGKIYLGINMEFKGLPLNQAIHGEQFLVALMHFYRDEPIKMALPAAPCGHCRQFLNEIGEAASSLIILTPKNPPETLAELLPRSFGPKDLGCEGGLLTPRLQSYHSNHLQPIYAKAIEAAFLSYAPYSHASSGVAIETHDGKIYYGSYLENVAFNPSLSPFHSALVPLVAAGHTYKDIKQVVLAEFDKADVSHEFMTELNLRLIAPEAKFFVEKVKEF